MRKDTKTAASPEIDEFAGIQTQPRSLAGEAGPTKIGTACLNRATSPISTTTAQGQRSGDRMKEMLRATYVDATRVSEAMIYALCDLRHLADAEGLAFAISDKRAHALYCAELQDGSHRQSMGTQQ